MLACPRLLHNQYFRHKQEETGVEAGQTWQNISAILEGMEYHIQELLALGIITDKKKKKNVWESGRLKDYKKMDLGII